MKGIPAITTIIKSSLFTFFIILFCSCDRSRDFDEYKELGSAWDKDSIVSFEFNRQDTLSKYNLFINIRSNNNYPYSNLFLIVQMEQPGTNIAKVDTLEYEMANPDGTLMGSGFTDVKESKLWYKQGVSFPKPGQYRVSIQQAVREAGQVPGVSELPGITEVGFRIESTQ